MNIWRKILICILVLFLCMGAGTGAMVLILNSIGISADQLSQLSDLNLNLQQQRVLKLAFGANHFLSFVISGFLLVMIFSHKRFFEYTGLKLPFNATLFLKFVALLLLSYPIFGFFMGIFQMIDLPDWAQGMDKQNIEALKTLLSMESPLDFLLNFIVIAVFAGVGEELIFRGVVQKELYKHVRPVYAVLIAAFIFAAFHLEISGFIPKFLIGTILGYSYFITKNLLYPILLHTLNNGMQVGLLYFSDNNLDKLEGLESSPDLMTLASSLLFVPFVYLLLVHLSKQHIDERNA